jgi:C-terminal processing protease CtpA/Prc
LDFREGEIVIDYVYELSRAHKMGVKPGQLVVKINGQNYEFSSYCDFVENFDIPEGDKIELELLRDNTPFLISLSKEKLL